MRHLSLIPIDQKIDIILNMSIYTQVLIFPYSVAVSDRHCIVRPGERQTINAV